MANIIEVSSDEESFFAVNLESDRKGIFSFGIDWDEIYMDSSDDDELVLIDLSVSKERTVLHSGNKSRFSHVSDDKEIEVRMKDRVPKKTRKNNNWAARAWGAWSIWRNQNVNECEKFRNVPRDIIDCSSKEELGYWLSRFVLETRKQDGSEYPYQSLYGLCTGLQRVLREDDKFCGVHIFDDKDKDFKRFVASLDSKMIELAKNGIGTETISADPVTKEDEEQLWDRGAISLDTAQGLSYGVYFYNCKLFGLRALDEHVEMEKEQLKIVPGSGGRFGIHFKGRLCKNAQGGLRHRKIPLKNLVHWGDPTNARDVIKLYEKYFSLIPEKGRFYRKPLKEAGKGPRFGKQPVGVNKLEGFVKAMFDAAKIDTTNRRITNHSIKASLCTIMWNDGFDDQQISSRSGHRSDALWRYKRMGKTMEHMISDALQPPKPKKKSTTKRITSTPKIPPSEATSQCIPTPSAGSSTIVRPGQIPSTGQSPASLNLVDIFDNLKRAGGGSVRIDSDNSITIDISK